MTISALDTECYRDYWLASFSTGEEFQMFDGHPLDIAGLTETLKRYTLITFNGETYDLPIIALALAGATNEQLKQASDQLIIGGMKHWDMLRHWGVRQVDHIDHIDMMNVAPGAGGLKSYGARMHTRKLQDLPITPDASINWAQRAILREYCRNDLQVTLELYETFKTQIALREEMSAEYGVDLRSKSDAQIAESVMRSILPFKPERPIVPTGSQFHFRPAPFLKFQALDVLELLANNPFTITETGGVLMTETLEKTVIRIGSTAYQMGIGGLHSKEASITHRAGDEYVLSDHDVASYYPSLILRTGIYPKQIGECFIDIYRGWYERRIAAKHAGDKKTANTLKTLLNGSFGKLGSPYSIFYAPSEMIQVTITGQLALLMLIEMLELSGIQVISANTDGIVIRCHRAMEWLRDSIIKWWEAETQFETEKAEYAILAQRDVNSYITIKTDGDVKLKGAYAPPEPGASGWPNPTGQICIDAIVEYLKHGTPLEQTIRACRDIRQFVYVRAVKGGGIVTWRPAMPKTPTKRRMGELLDKYGFSDYTALVDWSTQDTEYLGKTVRWYYATGSQASIRYSGSFNLVPRTEGCMPLMELEWRDDIDYDWYVREARSMMAGMGL